MNCNWLLPDYYGKYLHFRQILVKWEYKDKDNVNIQMDVVLDILITEWIWTLDRREEKLL
jgi:hypothetical protein